MQEFDYLESNLSSKFAKELDGRSLEAFKQEVKERATLLLQLRYSASQAIARIEQNIRWEFDDTWTHKEPAVLGFVETIVGDVYKNQPDSKRKS